MGVCALLIYLMHGMTEAHFEIFTMLAMLTIFGRVLPLLLAAATISVHHVLFWMYLPTALFHHPAGFSMVLMHAFFVILEVVPACWIALQFGQSVKGQGMVLERLGGAADQIARTAQQVASSSQVLAQGASEQAAAVEETSASTAEIDAMVRRTTENSSTTAEMVSASKERFEGSERSLTEMVAAMNAINASSEQIAGIIKVIDQIAFQTNILALNAAVEAARAGESGMGFSVVADEVRSLAKRSADAARETATLIETSIARSRNGLAKVGDVATEIQSISAQTAAIKRLVDEIKVGSQEQSQGVHQVSSAIQQIEKVTQTNAAAAQQTAAAAEEMAIQSKAIQEVFRHFAAMSGTSA
jgi:methyl-accepting chemotaxis protein